MEFGRPIGRRWERFTTGRLPCGSVNYNAANNSVTLTPRGTFPNVTMQLSINASLVLDAEGRQLDGDGDGTPGGSYTALLNNRGVVSAARSLATVREALATHLRLG